MFDKLYNSLKVILLSIEVSMLKPFSYKEAGVLGEITESSNVAEKIQDEPGGCCTMRKQGRESLSFFLGESENFTEGTSKCQVLGKMKAEKFMGQTREHSRWGTACTQSVQDQPLRTHARAEKGDE